MNKHYKTALVMMGLALLITGCGPGGSSDAPIGSDNMAVLTYPNFPDTPDEGNSWDHVPEGTNLRVKWYVDNPGWNGPSGLEEASQIIKDKTGISVDFDTPVSDDGQKLATMIAGDDLPDVITIQTDKTQTITGLAQQGYVYDINTIAQKWAPSLFDNLPQDVWNWWVYGNGKTYGVPNHYYSYDDVPEGEQLQPNGGMMVRKDVFNAWQYHVETTLKQADGLVHYTSLSGTPKTVAWQGYVTTPEGFKAAALWAKANYDDIDTGLQLAQFTQSGSSSLIWLSQFFAIPFEDNDGNYIYNFTDPRYEQMLYYLRDLYEAGVISPANFTQNREGAGGVIAGGKAFASLASPQGYQFEYLTSKDSGKEYISMYITNENGDAPVLQDIRGYGYMFNMITTQAKRPDLIIKLFDFLTSKEGQRLISFGPEGVTWNWTDATKTTIEYTQQYLDEKEAGSTAKYGLRGFDLFLNWIYYENMEPRTNNGKSVSDLYRLNLKRPLTQYSYDFNAMAFVVSATDSRFQTYSNNLTSIQMSLGAMIPKILKARDLAKAQSEYQTAVSAIRARGLDLVIEMDNEAFWAAKEKLGIQKAWPPFLEGYVNPLNRLQPNGDLTKYRTW